MWALEDLAQRWNCSQTAAAERAILEAHGSGVDLSEPLPASGSKTVDMPVSPIHAELTGAEDRVGFPIQCAHCPTGNWGSTKWATICFDCKSAGHTNQPADCPRCGMDYGTGAL